MWYLYKHKIAFNKYTQNNLSFVVCGLKMNINLWQPIVVFISCALCLVLKTFFILLFSFFVFAFSQRCAEGNDEIACLYIQAAEWGNVIYLFWQVVLVWFVWSLFCSNIILVCIIYMNTNEKNGKLLIWFLSWCVVRKFQNNLTNCQHIGYVCTNHKTFVAMDVNARDGTLVYKKEMKGKHAQQLFEIVRFCYPLFFMCLCHINTRR